MAKALPELIKGKLVEEKHNVVLTAQALKALGTGHNPTPEQWKGLGSIAFRAAFIGGSMMMGDPTGAVAHGAEAAGAEVMAHVAGHGLMELAHEVGNELMTHVLVEHALKTMVGGGMLAMGAIGHGKKQPAHDADPGADPNVDPAAGGDPTPEDMAQVQKFLQALAQSIAQMDEPTARKILEDNQGPPRGSRSGARRRMDRERAPARPAG